MISATNSTRDPRYIIAGVVVFEGQKEDIDVIRIGKDAREKYRDLFIPTNPRGNRYIRVPPATHKTRTNRVNGLLLANHTGFVDVLDEIRNGCQKLYTRKAFIKPYAEHYDIDHTDDLGETRNVIDGLRIDYKELESGTYEARDVYPTRQWGS
ncbi:unnamed protein product [Bursaphelenchus okinawaensis]|uniref:Uncharacterized protein n=1 Tax=Bursaphelenchus okinawaensis TaxID=465554 RepID=A0A811LT20_9BILA|nr:unnamed protein product [Bursaphelenchus okinawaensis]CAG9128032.1 unnamed protein product [Bursaphelenchus okinawaensis]